MYKYEPIHRWGVMTKNGWEGADGSVSDHPKEHTTFETEDGAREYSSSVKRGVVTRVLMSRVTCDHTEPDCITYDSTFGILRRVKARCTLCGTHTAGFGTESAARNALEKQPLIRGVQ